MLAHRDVPVVSYAPRPLRAMVSSLVIIGTVEDCNRTRTGSAQGELEIYMWGMQVSHQGGLTGARAAGAYVTGPVLNSLGVTAERRLKPCCSRGRRWRCCRRTYLLRDQRNVRGRRLIDWIGVEGSALAIESESLEVVRCNALRCDLMCCDAKDVACAEEGCTQGIKREVGQVRSGTAARWRDSWAERGREESGGGYEGDQ